MFFVLSKIISSFTDPFFLSIVLFVFAIVIKNMKYKKRFALASMLVIVFFGNELVCNYCFAKWEDGNAAEQYQKTYRYGIALGGFTTYQSNQNKQVYFNESSDRLLTAIQLYKQGKIEKIVLSGGESRLISENQKEAVIAAEYLYSIGIPKEDVISETASRNTHENASYTADLLLPKLQKGEKVLLITSAYHMQRAEACFSHEGFLVDSYPTDYYIIDENPWYNLFTIKIIAVDHWRLLIHEIIGYFIYDWMGYF